MRFCLILLLDVLWMALLFGAMLFFVMRPGRATALCMRLHLDAILGTCT